MARTAVLGFPRIGPDRELKFALEEHWAGRMNAYPGQVGPGIYDIHSPRVPAVGELESLLALAEELIPRKHLWVNPDCGLKTRAWPETQAALANLVAAAQRRRSSVASES